MSGVKLYCKFTQEKLPIFSLNFQDINPYDISQYLSDNYGIQTRAGCSCAGPYGHDLLNLEDGQSFDEKPGWLRVSMHFTHTKEEIDILIEGIKKAIKDLSKA
jgi:selenocysteine lyase/cysteine desulfurase